MNFFSVLWFSEEDSMVWENVALPMIKCWLLEIIFLRKCKLMCKFIVKWCNNDNKDCETWALFNISSFDTLYIIQSTFLVK